MEKLSVVVAGTVPGLPSSAQGEGAAAGRARKRGAVALNPVPRGVEGAVRGAEGEREREGGRARARGIAWRPGKAAVPSAGGGGARGGGGGRYGAAIGGSGVVREWRVAAAAAVWGGRGRVPRYGHVPVQQQRRLLVVLVGAGRGRRSGDPHALRGADAGAVGVAGRNTAARAATPSTSRSPSRLPLATPTPGRVVGSGGNGRLPPGVLPPPLPPGTGLGRRRSLRCGVAGFGTPSPLPPSGGLAGVASLSRGPFLFLSLLGVPGCRQARRGRYPAAGAGV